MGGRLAESTVVSTDKVGDGGVHVPQRLLVGTGQHVATHMLPDDGVVTIGRAPEANVRVDDPSVSRLHARLHLGPAVRLEDLGGANGTRIGGARLAANQLTPLPPGQVAEIGASWIMIANAPLSGSTARQKTGVIDAIRQAALAPPPADGLVVEDEAMRNLHRLIEKAALSDISVLLLGETGVGKEVFARRIHTLSPRADKPFLGLNCAALAGSLLESELFGHERGAFTGAVQGKPGLLETADGGTVLLDEVGDMPAAIQVKLLRVLEERQVLRIGGTRSRPIDVRVLSATNRNLDVDVEAGTFRRDLFFRLNSITIAIPPLRERRAEIEPLARQFASLAAKRMGGPLPQFDPPVWDRLRAYNWPGNVRQLRNMMERAVVLAEGGKITDELLPVDTYVGPTPAQQPGQPPRAEATPPPPLAQPDDPDAERRRIADALERCAGNQTRAAAMLGISRRTMVSRMAEFNLPRPRKRSDD